VPDPVSLAEMGVPQLYVRASDALDLSGDGIAAGRVAEEAYHRFADHPDRPSAAVICQRAAHFRVLGAPAAGMLLIKQALGLFEQVAPSAAHAEALLDYVYLVQRTKGWLEGNRAALNRALEIAEAAGAAALIPQILANLAADAFLRGQVEPGLAFLQQ